MDMHWKKAQIDKSDGKNRATTKNVEQKQEFRVQTTTHTHTNEENQSIPTL